MDNVFDAQHFGGRVHGVLLVVGGFVHQKGLGVEKNSNQPRYGGSGRPMMKTRDLGSAYEVVALIVAKAARR